MPALASFLLFVSIAIAIIASGHYYVWLRLVRDLDWSTGIYRALSILVIALFVSVLLAFFAGRQLPRSWGPYAMLPVYVWLGVLWILVVTLGAAEVVRFAALKLGSLIGQAHAEANVTLADPGRRLLIAQIFASVVALIAGGASAVALKEGLGRVRVKRVAVPLLASGRTERDQDRATLGCSHRPNSGPRLLGGSGRQRERTQPRRHRDHG